MPAAKKTTLPAIERIRAAAHQIWLDAGMPEGEADLHWALAEAQVTKEDDAPKAKKATAARKKAA